MHMSKIVMACASLACLLLAGAANADTALTDLQANAAAAKANAIKDGWQGSVAFGYLQTTGNSNTTTLNAKALAGWKSGDWQDAFLFQTLKASADGVVNAESTNLNAQTDYNLSSLNYVFGNVDYLRDVFSGYESRTSEVVGYGHRFLSSDTQQLDLEVGAGARQTRYTDQTSESEPVEQLTGSYLYKFTKTSNFSENLTLIHGASNTYSQSVSALTVNLAGSFALSVSDTVSHNSTVLPGFKNTDTITAVSLVYSFAPPEPPAAAATAVGPATPPP
jgi:putative salt-induced outer membrane protein